MKYKSTDQTRKILLSSSIEWRGTIKFIWERKTVNVFGVIFRLTNHGWNSWPIKRSMISEKVKRNNCWRILKISRIFRCFILSRRIKQSTFKRITWMTDYNCLIVMILKLKMVHMFFNMVHKQSKVIVYSLLALTIRSEHLVSWKMKIKWTKGQGISGKSNVCHSHLQIWSHKYFNKWIRIPRNN